MPVMRPQAPAATIDADSVPLCHLVLAAERLSLRCTGMQAKLARGLPCERPLVVQQRHECGHVILFRSVLAVSRPADDALERPLTRVAAYEARLQAALARGDLADSLVGLQIVLEGIGTELFRGFTVAPSLERIRRRLLLQEEAHHALGERLLAQLADVDDGALRASARGYVDAGRAMLEAADPWLRRAGIAATDPADALPDWLRS